VFYLVIIDVEEFVTHLFASRFFCKNSFTKD
jgi:hypothetical protein